MQQPSVGRIVHYVSYGTPGGEYGRECRAAVITAVSGPIETLDLCVLNPAGLFFNQGVLQHAGRPAGEDTNLCHGMDHDGGTWHWPERV